MATAAKLFLSTLLLFFFLKVNGQRCDLSDVQIVVTNTGQKFGINPIFEVEVKNECACPLTNVYVSCPQGFVSLMSLDPKAFRQDGTDFLVNDGQGIPRYGSFKFLFAWVYPFKMAPSSIRIACW